MSASYFVALVYKCLKLSTCNQRWGKDCRGNTLQKYVSLNQCLGFCFYFILLLIWKILVRKLLLKNRLIVVCRLCQRIKGHVCKHACSVLVSSCNDELNSVIRKISVFQELGTSLLSSWRFRFPLTTLCHRFTNYFFLMKSTTRFCDRPQILLTNLNLENR